MRRMALTQQRKPGESLLIDQPGLGLKLVRMGAGLGAVNKVGRAIPSTPHSRHADFHSNAPAPVQGKLA